MTAKVYRFTGPALGAEGEGGVEPSLPTEVGIDAEFADPRRAGPEDSLHRLCRECSNSIRAILFCLCFQGLFTVGIALTRLKMIMSIPSVVDKLNANCANATFGARSISQQGR